MIGKRSGEKKCSSRGMYMRSIADMPKLCAIEKCIWVRKNESENN
jgi:hypothetical protein